MTTNIFVGAMFLIGCGLGVLGAWLILRRGYIAKSDHHALAALKQTAETKAEERKAEIDKLQAELRGERGKSEQKAQEFHAGILDVTQQIARLETENKGLHEKLSQGETALKNMELRFENLANRIFQEKTDKFRQDSEVSLGQLLQPLKGELEQFRKNVTDSFGKHANEQHSLKNEIERIVQANKEITEQAGNLTKALKGDTKTQGNWGEVVLEKILEDCGLRKGADYILQGAGLDLMGDGGARQKPDVIVMLPENRHIVIDAKVTLTYFERYYNEADAVKRDAALKQFLASVRAHVQGLEQRRYQDNDQLITPDYVFMFMPVEGAFMLAIQQDQALHEYAWARKIAIVGPTTLFATLRTIASMWRIVRQEQNARKIAQQAGALHDKVAAFAEKMQDIGKKIDAAQSAYDSAWKQLSAGRGNILSKIDRLREMGVKTSKALPRELMIDNDAEDAEDAEEADLLEQELMTG